MLAYGNDHHFTLRGKKVPGSDAYYLPYGDYRDEPGSGEMNHSTLRRSIDLPRVHDVWLI
jgi:hypothetical protein